MRILRQTQTEGEDIMKYQTPKRNIENQLHCVHLDVCKNQSQGEGWPGEEDRETDRYIRTGGQGDRQVH